MFQADLLRLGWTFESRSKWSMMHLDLPQTVVGHLKLAAMGDFYNR